MSQIYKSVNAGDLPPSVPTSFVTDVNSPSIPIANVENVKGGQSSVNNVNGVQTDGSSGSNTLTVQLTNRVTGSVSTTGVTTSNVLTFVTPNIAGVYQLSINIVAYDAADAIGSTFYIYGAIKADGVGGLATIGTPIREMDGEATFNVSQVTVSFSSLTITVPVTGLTGKTIKWTGLMTYVFGGA